ncbi:tellurite resistance TerB family protein [Aquabacterium sp. A3]|uniref:tellurite resistance TerB family protein n=1 Tax=Aquabacterium sp. A3 TaxID=3132829 RepID=UPI003119AD3B
MRNPACNSPEAAARILALSLLADGQVSPSELNRLRQLDVDGRLGLPPGGFEEVLRQVSQRQDAQQALLASMADVTDPGLRLIVLQLCGAAIDADAHVADEERRVLQQLADHWQLPVPVLRSPNAYPAARRRHVSALVL